MLKRVMMQAESLKLPGAAMASVSGNPGWGNAWAIQKVACGCSLVKYKKSPETDDAETVSLQIYASREFRHALRLDITRALMKAEL